MKIDPLVKSLNVDAFQILDQINKKKNQTTWDVIEELDIPQATVYRAVQKMKKLGIVSQDTEKDSPLIAHFKVDVILKKNRLFT
jgi:predicted transcriptional regulator